MASFLFPSGERAATRCDSRSPPPAASSPPTSGEAAPEPSLLQRRRQPRPAHPYNYLMAAGRGPSSPRYGTHRLLRCPRGFPECPIQGRPARLRRHRRARLLQAAGGCVVAALVYIAGFGGRNRPLALRRRPTTQRSWALPIGSRATATVASGPRQPSMLGEPHPDHGSLEGRLRTPHMEVAPSTNQTTTSTTKSTGAIVADPCDCLTPLVPGADDARCCRRLALRAHKMGVVLLRDYLPEVPSAIVHPRELPPRMPAARDYRHVVLTRPLEESILSGYLYHLSGRECWLDQNGLPRRVNKTFDWTIHLQYPTLVGDNDTDYRQIIHENRTLCEYLALTSPKDEYRAMRTYMDWSLNDLYAGLVPYYREAQDRADNKTLYVCFHELSHPEAQARTLARMREWLYPRRPLAGDNAINVGEDMTKISESLYHGGHSTSKDPRLRLRLLSLIRRLDQEWFQNRAAEATALFGCEQENAEVK